MVKAQNLFGEVREIHRNMRALFKGEGGQKGEPGVPHQAGSRSGATCRHSQPEPRGEKNHTGRSDCE